MRHRDDPITARSIPKNAVLGRDEILDRYRGVQAINHRAVDNFIVKLRRKIETTPDRPQHILTVYGHGYKLVL